MTLVFQNVLFGFAQLSDQLEFVGCGATAPLPPPLGEVAAPRGLTERVSLGRSITFGSPPQSKIKDFCQLPQGGSQGNAIPSPGGKGDREAVDEEWRYIPILNAVNSNGTDFSNVPF